MRESTTGTALIRAGVPQGWVVADKTGAGSYGTRNDIAVVRPPGRDPVVMAVLTSRDGQRDEREHVGHGDHAQHEADGGRSTPSTGGRPGRGRSGRRGGFLRGGRSWSRVWSVFPATTTVNVFKLTSNNICSRLLLSL